MQIYDRQNEYTYSIKKFKNITYIRKMPAFFFYLHLSTNLYLYVSFYIFFSLLL